MMRILSAALHPGTWAVPRAAASTAPDAERAADRVQVGSAKNSSLRSAGTPWKQWLFDHLMAPLAFRVLRSLMPPMAMMAAPPLKMPTPQSDFVAAASDQRLARALENFERAGCRITKSIDIPTKPGWRDQEKTDAAGAYAYFEKPQAALPTVSIDGRGHRFIVTQSDLLPLLDYFFCSGDPRQLDDAELGSRLKQLNRDGLNTYTHVPNLNHMFTLPVEVPTYLGLRAGQTAEVRCGRDKVATLAGSSEADFRKALSDARLKLGQLEPWVEALAVPDLDYLIQRGARANRGDYGWEEARLATSLQNLESAGGTFESTFLGKKISMGASQAYGFIQYMSEKKDRWTLRVLGKSGQTEVHDVGQLTALNHFSHQGDEKWLDDADTARVMREASKCGLQFVCAREGGDYGVYQNLREGKATEITYDGMPLARTNEPSNLPPAVRARLALEQAQKLLSARPLFDNDGDMSGVEKPEFALALRTLSRKGWCFQVAQEDPWKVYVGTLHTRESLSLSLNGSDREPVPMADLPTFAYFQQCAPQSVLKEAPLACRLESAVADGLAIGNAYQAYQSIRKGEAVPIISGHVRLGTTRGDEVSLAAARAAQQVLNGTLRPALAEGVVVEKNLQQGYDLILAEREGATLAMRAERLVDMHRLVRTVDADKRFDIARDLYQQPLDDDTLQSAAHIISHMRLHDADERKKLFAYLSQELPTLSAFPAVRAERLQALEVAVGLTNAVSDACRLTETLVRRSTAEPLRDRLQLVSDIQEAAASQKDYRGTVNDIATLLSCGGGHDTEARDVYLTLLSTLAHMQQAGDASTTFAFLQEGVRSGAFGACSLTEAAERLLATLAVERSLPSARQRLLAPLITPAGTVERSEKMVRLGTVMVPVNR